MDNYLIHWKQFVHEEKWKQVKHNDPYYKNYESIYNVLVNFFGKKEFDTTQPVNPNNWIIHILANKQMSSIYLVNEIAELIRYYDTLENKESYALRTKSNKVNYRELREKFFEIYLNYLFHRFVDTTVLTMPAISVKLCH